MKKLKLGLTFFFDYSGWAGGVIYKLNIIYSLNLLPDEEKPELFIYYNSISPIEDIKKINYPFIKYFKFETYPPSAIVSTLSFISIKLLGKSFLFKEKPDLVYPYVNFLSYGKRSFFWIPDFQERYLPDFFSASEILARTKWHKNIAANKKGVVVFSSNDALNDFTTFYPDYKCKTALVRFACILPEFKHLEIDGLREKFGIKKHFFIVTNQFWAHKNHKVILDAIVLFKSREIDFQVVFTGSTQDKRNLDFFTSLHDFIVHNEIIKRVVFLGFIDREEQLKLMDEAIAIIQPSLFEGWSTVVEDAKALSQHIILSNIKVHKEQVSENCTFFDPHDSNDLGVIMERYLTDIPERTQIDYTTNIQRFGREFLNVTRFNE